MRLQSYICFIALMLFAANGLNAAPYGLDGVPIEFIQADGSTLRCRVLGDEFYGRTVSEEGYTLIYDHADRSYHYAALTRDGTSFTSTGVRANLPPPDNLVKGLKIPLTEVKKIQETNRKLLIGDRDDAWRTRVSKVRSAQAAVKNLSSKSNLLSRASTLQSAQNDLKALAVSGQKVGLTILVQFPDDSATAAIDPVNFPVNQAKIIRYCNSVGYTEDGNTGSVRDYFYDQSLGSLTYLQSVTPILTLPHPRNYYNYSNYPTNTILLSMSTAGRRIVQDAINILISSGFDFSNLTTSGDKIVATNVLFAGEDSGVWSSGLWAHSSSLVDPGINVGSLIYPSYISRYQITKVNTTAPVIGTFIHENGHLLLGYPDLYDYDQDSEGVGAHCLMGSGNHSNSGKTPSPINLYLAQREFMGSRFWSKRCDDAG